jgi:predicted deacylase
MAQDWTSVSPDGLDLTSPGVRFHEVALAFEYGGETGRIGLPLAVARGERSGPAVLVAGGTHGDEYEGRIAAASLVRRLEASLPDLAGTLIVLPQHNLPACRAGTRRTPLDGADLNRLYPPPPEATGPSAAIARFVVARLLPQIDWLIDLHSGGSAHEFVPSANLQAPVGSAECRAMLPALLAFGAPYAIILGEAEAGSLAMPHAGTLEGLARTMGKRAISSELGGAGRITPVSLAVAERGLRNLLAHIGVLPGTWTEPAERSVLLVLGGPEHHVPSPVEGVFAPRVWLGEDVRKGDLLGEVHPLDPGAPPATVRALCDGIVVGVASRGSQERGAVLFYVAEPFRDADA